MSKPYSLEIKLRAISLYQSGYGSVHIGELLSVDDSHIRHWIRLYRHKGVSGFQKKSYKPLTAEFRLKVATEVLRKYLSCEQAAFRYAVSKSAVFSWVRQLKTEGYGALMVEKSRGRPPKSMGRPKKREPQTELEKLQQENARLQAENALLKKVKALVEQRAARVHGSGRKPSKS